MGQEGTATEAEGARAGHLRLRPEGSQLMPATSHEICRYYQRTRNQSAKVLHDAHACDNPFRAQEQAHALASPFGITLQLAGAVYLVQYIIQKYQMSWQTNVPRFLLL